MKQWKKNMQLLKQLAYEYKKKRIEYKTRNFVTRIHINIDVELHYRRSIHKKIIPPRHNR